MTRYDFDLICKRKVFSTRSTIGQFWGSLPDSSELRALGVTLEDEARPSGVKIPAFTAIPAGDYKLKITMSNRFKRDLPIIYTHDEYNGEQLVLVDGKHVWRGVRIHSGNTDGDSEGCILTGLTSGKDIVFESRKALNDLVMPFIENHPSLKALGFIRFRIENDQTV